MPLEKIAVRRRSGSASSLAARCKVGFSNLFNASDLGKIVTRSDWATSEIVDSL